MNLRHRAARREQRDTANRRLIRLLLLARAAGWDVKDLAELLPAISGGAPVDSALAQNGSTVALSGAEASLFTGAFATGIPLQQAGPGRVAPLGIAFGFVPTVSGVSSAASVTVNLRNGVSTGGGVVGGGIATNSGAGTSSVGALLGLGLAVATQQNLWVGGVTSAGTGTAGNGAIPLVGGVIFLD